MLLNQGLFSQNSDTENRQLWLLTAKVSVNSTYVRDTIDGYSVESMQIDKKFHQTSETSASSTISAVIENQAENPLKEFFYDSGSGEPVRMSVTGKGTHTETTIGSETINGKLISADERTDNVSGSAQSAYIQFVYSDDYKMVSISTGMNARGISDARLYFDGWKDYGGEIEDYVINCDGGCNLSDDKNCKITKTGKGYTASWSLSENEKERTSNGIAYSTKETSIDVTLVPYKESDKPVVMLQGCQKLGVGETGTVTAVAKPEGGSYKFWVEPADLITVSVNDATATLTGQTPGRGVLMVEYTTPDGKTAQTSVEASCIKIESYNGGQAIPQIAFYDIDGKKKTGVITVPVTAQPSDAIELVTFELTNPGVLSAVGIGTEVTLQGITLGKTSLQAKTTCGASTGPAVEVEVVNCDDETNARLAEMMRLAKEEQKRTAEEIEKILGSKEFEKASDHIAESTGNLAIKTGGLIIGTLSGGAGKGVQTAAGIYGTASGALDVIKGGGDIIKQVSNLSQFIVQLGGSAMQQAIAGGTETLDAAREFGEDLGVLKATSIRLKGATDVYEQANRQVERISGLQSICRKGTKPQPKQDQAPAVTEKPKTDPTPKPNPTPTPKQDATPKPEPTNPVPKTEEPTVQEPQTEDPIADDEVLVDPERPVIPPRQVGLPYEPGDCGCDKSRALTANSESFSTMQTGMDNLQKCVDNFSSGPLTEYINTLKEWINVTEGLEKAVNTGEKELIAASKEAIPIIESLLVRTKSFDEAGKIFLDEFKACPESMKAGVEVLNSVNKITVESLKLKY